MTIDRPNRRGYVDSMAQWVPPPLPAELMARRRGPLVGRAAELAAFEQAWERVESGNRQAVFIGGEPGAGKTRLAAEVAGTLADHDVAVLVGCSSRLHRIRSRSRSATRARSCGGCRLRWIDIWIPFLHGTSGQPGRRFSTP